MQVDIIDMPLQLTLHGFSGAAINKDYAGTAFRLMDKMWQIVKGNELANKGLNIWVYEPHDIVFAGVELDKTPVAAYGLEEKTILLPKYASCTHIGPYQAIPTTGRAMQEKLKQMGLKSVLPYIEIYGHYTNDENKLETQLLHALG